MTMKRCLSLALTLLLAAGLFAFSMPQQRASAQTFYDAFTVGKDVVSLASGALNIASYFTRGGPDPAIMDALNEIRGTLAQIQSSLQHVQESIAVLYSELQQDKQYAQLQTAWNSIGTIKEKYNQLKTFYNNPPTDQEGFDLQKAQFEQWAQRVLGSDRMDDLVSDWHEALSETLPGSTDGSALDIATKLAILNCNPNSPSQDFSTSLESLNGVPVVAERPMYFNYNRTRDGGHTEAGAGAAGDRFYFAEGTLRPGFVTYFCLLNPSGSRADVRATYLRGDGTSAEQKVSVAPRSRATLCPELVIPASDGPEADFSTLVESTNGVGIVAERPTYFEWDCGMDGGTVDAGSDRTSERFYFAEGSTRPGFDTYFSVMNPGSRRADVRLTYMRGDGTVARQDIPVRPRGRATVRARDMLGSVDGAASDFATRVESTNGVGVVAERPMYFDYGGRYAGGHCETGVTEPGRVFYLAEGTTRPGFESFICLLNPGESDARVRITYMKGDGTTSRQSLTVPPRTRSTVRATDLLGSSDDPACDFSAAFESTNGTDFIVERPMYFSYDGRWEGGSCEPGTASPVTQALFAEGSVREDFDTYFCLLNPGKREAHVRLTYMKGDGKTQQQTLRIPARSRHTVAVDKGYTSSNDLMGVYQTYLEPLFWNSFTYQALGARMICEAKTKNPSLINYKDYMAERFNKDFAGPEADKFLSCVERLVVSQIRIGPDSMSKPGLSDPGCRLADRTNDVLSRANFFAAQARGQADGLRGTFIRNTGLGDAPALTAGSAAPSLMSGGEVLFTGRRADGMGVVQRLYPNWKNGGPQGELSAGTAFQVTRYYYRNMAGPYSIFNGSQKLCDVNVPDSVVDPGDPGKQVGAKFAHFTAFENRMGPEMTMEGANAAASLTPGAYGWARQEPVPGYRFGLASGENGWPNGTYESVARADRTFVFAGGQDRSATITGFARRYLVTRFTWSWDRQWRSYPQAHWYAVLRDRTTNQDFTLRAESLNNEIPVGPGDVSFSADVTLKAGHSYSLGLVSRCNIRTEGQSAYAESQLAMTGLYITLNNQ